MTYLKLYYLRQIYNSFFLRSYVISILFFLKITIKNLPHDEGDK
jgi:hypothetical protein